MACFEEGVKPSVDGIVRKARPSVVAVEPPQIRRHFRGLRIVLGIGLIGAGFAIVVLPYLPQLEGPQPLTFPQASTALAAYTKTASSTPTAVSTPGQQLPTIASSVAATPQPGPAPEIQPQPTENSIVIPSIGVDEAIVQGTSDSVLDQGAWLRPDGVTPDHVGNTIIAGHRYEFLSGPRTFYFLDRVKPGDEILVYWNGAEYHYVVDSNTTVPADDTAIEAPTAGSVLTVYTCTPIWSETNRMVVVAHYTERRLYPVK